MWLRVRLNNAFIVVLWQLSVILSFHLHPTSIMFSRKPKERIPRPDLTHDQLKRATRTRKIFGLLTSFFLVITTIFLILVEIAGTSNDAVIRDWYFLKIDLAHIIPRTVPNAGLINTIAQSLGLHDWYQVGLWGFCSGYVGEGVTFCSKPQTLYWFNPVEILTNELLAGASSECSRYSLCELPIN